MKTTIEAIEKLINLPKNANSYGSELVRQESIDAAKWHLGWLVDEFPNPKVAASPSGNVVLTWYREKDAGELSIEFIGDEREYSLLSNYSKDMHTDEEDLLDIVCGWK